MKIIIPGNPVPKHRPRFSRNGRVYNDQRKYMNDFSFIVKAQYNNPILIGPLSIDITFFMKIPNSLSRLKQSRLNGQYHYAKIDLDNLLKLSWDVLSGIIFEDDCQIALCSSRKLWSDNPRTEFEISSLK